MTCSAPPPTDHGDRQQFPPPTFLFQDDRHHIWVIIGHGHVQWRLQVDAAHGAGQGRSLLRQRRSFLGLQVGVGTLLQELCSEVSQAMPTGRVQRGFSLNRNTWSKAEPFQGGSSYSPSAETQIPVAVTALAHPVTSWPPQFLSHSSWSPLFPYPCHIPRFVNVFPSTRPTFWQITFCISNDLLNHPSLCFYN